MPSHTIRALAESKNNSDQVKDTFNNKDLFWWRGSSVKLEVALTTRGQFLTASDIGTLTVVVKDSSATQDDPALMIKELTSDQCNPHFDSSVWQDGKGALATFEWTKEEASLAAGTYVIIITNDDQEGNRDTYLHAQIKVEEDQHDSTALSNPPPITAPAYNLLTAITAAYNSSVSAGFNGSLTEWIEAFFVEGGVTSVNEAVVESVLEASNDRLTLAESKLDETPRLAGDNIFTGVNQFTDDVRVLHNPTDPDAVLPLRMMDERYSSASLVGGVVLAEGRFEGSDTAEQLEAVTTNRGARYSGAGVSLVKLDNRMYCSQLLYVARPSTGSYNLGNQTTNFEGGGIDANATRSFRHEGENGGYLSTVMEWRFTMSGRSSTNTQMGHIVDFGWVGIDDDALVAARFFASTPSSDLSMTKVESTSWSSQLPDETGDVEDPSPSTVSNSSNSFIVRLTRTVNKTLIEVFKNRVLVYTTTSSVTTTARFSPFFRLKANPSVGTSGGISLAGYKIYNK